MTVLHVFAQANVGDDEQRRHFFFQQPDGLLDDAIFRISTGSLRVFFVGNAKKQDCRDAVSVGARRFADQFIRRKLKDAGHGGDGVAQLAPATNKHRQHELLDAQARFGDKPSQRRRLPQPARAITRKLSDTQIHKAILVSK